MTRQQQYDQLFKTLDSLFEGETDPVSLMATITCELYQTFEQFHWVGFYRNVGQETLKIGPYQGAHGCLTIPFTRGLCGRCAREKKVLNIPDVTQEPDHIACSATTKSEIVIPITDHNDQILAILDIDSNSPAAFDEIDETNLMQINKYFV
jgi:L-methionine (R)-S-oxide reductase